MRILRTSGGVLHFWTSELVSNRKTLVFINSLGTDFRIWDGVLKALDGRFNMVLHDKAGHGLSNDRPRLTKISDLADDLDAILKHLSLSKVVMCGISIGGLVAQSFFHKRPQAVQALILSNTGLKIGTTESWNARIAAVEKGGIASVADSIVESWFAPVFLEHKQDEYTLYRNMLLRTSHQGYLACCEAIRDADFTSQATKITVPVLCIGGEYDRSTPPATVEAMASTVAGGVEIIKGTAHLPPIEKPVTYAKLIETFVNSI